MSTAIPPLIPVDMHHMVLQNYLWYHCWSDGKKENKISVWFKRQHFSMWNIWHTMWQLWL